MRIVCDDINGFLRRRKGDSKDRIVLTGFADPQGGFPADAEDSIFFLLTRIAEEKNLGPRGHLEGPPGLIPRVRNPAYLNLHVMFASMYRRYEIGLQALTEVIAYLQGKPVYTPQNTRTMDPALGTLAFQMITLGYAEQSYLWGSLGAKYVPSVLYSLRLLRVGEEELEALDPSITRATVNGQPGVTV